jgi:hypothetical protein
VEVSDQLHASNFAVPKLKINLRCLELSRVQKSSETSVSYRKTTWRHKLVDLDLNFHLRESLKTQVQTFRSLYNVLERSQQKQLVV